LAPLYPTVQLLLNALFPLVYRVNLLEKIKEAINKVDLTGAGSLISFEVAQNFLLEGNPTKDDLNKMIKDTASRMRFMRTLVGLNPDERTPICLDARFTNNDKDKDTYINKDKDTD
jgi:hypothetical protein